MPADASPQAMSRNGLLGPIVSSRSLGPDPCTRTTAAKGTGPFAAVVLVQGSGPSDRDETIGPNKPFRDIAWGLASAGIAVLRYDKRTFVYGAQMAPDTTITVRQET